MDKNIYATYGSSLELDEAIIRLKELGRNISVLDLVTTMNIEKIIEMLQIIERVNIPLRMGEEGIA